MTTTTTPPTLTVRQIMRDVLETSGTTDREELIDSILERIEDRDAALRELVSGALSTVITSGAKASRSGRSAFETVEPSIRRSRQAAPPLSAKMEARRRYTWQSFLESKMTGADGSLKRHADATLEDVRDAYERRETTSAGLIREAAFYRRIEDAMLASGAETVGDLPEAVE